jgi:hypothetical protein
VESSAAGLGEDLRCADASGGHLGWAQSQYSSPLGQPIRGVRCNHPDADLYEDIADEFWNDGTFLGL